MKFRVFDYVRSESIKPIDNRYYAVRGFKWLAKLLAGLGILKRAYCVDTVQYERVVVNYDKLQELVWHVGARDPRRLKTLLLGMAAGDALMDEFKEDREVTIPFQIFGTKVILSPYAPDDAIIPLWDVD
jgi:hypothetical protein